MPNLSISNCVNDKGQIVLHKLVQYAQEHGFHDVTETPLKEAAGQCIELGMLLAETGSSSPPSVGDMMDHLRAVMVSFTEIMADKARVMAEFELYYRASLLPETSHERQI